MRAALRIMSHSLAQQFTNHATRIVWAAPGWPKGRSLALRGALSAVQLCCVPCCWCTLQSMLATQPVLLHAIYRYGGDDKWVALCRLLCMLDYSGLPGHTHRQLLQFLLGRFSLTLSSQHECFRPSALPLLECLLVALTEQDREEDEWQIPASFECCYLACGPCMLSRPQGFAAAAGLLRCM